MTRLTPWQREREHAAAPTPADAEGYAPDAAPECWVRRPVGGALVFAIVLWRDPSSGWLLRLGPDHGCRLVEVGGALLSDVDAILAAHGYTLEPV